MNMQPTELAADELAAIRARHEAATPGEWDTNWNNRGTIIYSKDGSLVLDLYPHEYLAMDPHRVDIKLPDLRFILGARADIPALLSHADALQAKVEHAEARWQKDAMQIDTDFNDLREERDEALAKVATMETLCDSLKEKVARLEGERDAKQRTIDSWEDGREWWECTKCGDRYHGTPDEAPFHDRNHSGDPYCNPCGEGGQ